MALADLDANKDHKLDARELDRCPALKKSLKSLDKNNDGSLDADEIEERLTKLLDSKIGLLAVSCRVHQNQQPVDGALVTLIPEKFMGANFKAASGTSGADGQVNFQIEGEPFPGVACGFYRIEVSKKNSAGQETLPPRFNTQSLLGQEISPFWRGAIEIDLAR